MTDGRIERFYAEQYDEAARLTRSPHGRLELLRTQQLLQEWLPAAPARVLDVGGGTGVYAAWLRDRGYAVRLVDPVAHHVDQATARGVEAVVGDARHLDEPAGFWDAILLLGPLYHLPERTDRVQSLIEAVRVTRPGGVVIAAAISRSAALIDHAVNGPWDADVLARLESVLHDGRHDPSLGFTTAFFHTPAELGGELREAGYVDVAVRAVEGPLGYAVDLAGDPEVDELIDRAATTAALMQDDLSTMGASPHLLAFGRASVDAD